MLVIMKRMGQPCHDMINVVSEIVKGSVRVENNVDETNHDMTYVMNKVVNGSRATSSRDENGEERKF